MTGDPSYNLSMIFARTSGWHFSDITITHRTILVLSHVNGKRSLAEIAETLNLPYDDLFSDLQQLHGMRLVKMAAPNPLGPPDPPRIKRIKQGCYRGASFQIEEH